MTRFRHPNPPCSAMPTSTWTLRRTWVAAQRAALALTLISSLPSCLAKIADPGAAQDDDPNNPGNPGGDPTDPGGDQDPTTVAGSALWAAQCATCHGAFMDGSSLSTGDTNGDFRLDARAAVERRGDGLEAYIAQTMPFLAADQCVGECAQATGAYIRARQVEVNDQTCAESQALAYGRRSFKLLTSVEYQNALEDLLGVNSVFGTSVANNDGVLGGFINMKDQAVNGSLMQTYLGNAERVAAAAVGAGQPFTCANGTTAADCANRFVDEFLYRAFRAPVSDATRAAYIQLFQDYPNDGLQLALEAALSSPQFLYRVEAGVDLATARAAGYYTNTGAPTSGDAETIAAADFPPGQGRYENGARAFFENGAVEIRFTTAFTASSVIEVDARGSNHRDLWPDLAVQVGTTPVGRQSVNSADVRTYRFEVTGASGTPAVRLSFDNDSGEPPYGPGQDSNLFIIEARLITASSDPAPEPDPNAESPLDGVATDAFVLTPYELASTLSFMLTGSTPDAALLDAARRDELTTTAQVRAQVERLIDSPRGRQRFGDFVTEWFHLDKVEDASRPDIPELTPQVKASMVQEVREHFAHVFYDDTVPFSEFYGGDYTFLNRSLAEFYGIAGNFGDQFVQTTVDRRGGPIASGAFMTSYGHVERSAPILRAVHARQDALCHYIDPPNSPIAGDDIDAQRAAAQAAVTQREMEEGALSSREFYYLYTDGIDACAGCHERIINPMFGMEDFDQVGRLRPLAGAEAVQETINGIQTTVPLSGILYGVDSTSDAATIEFAGAKDFSNKIADTDAVKSCLVRRGFRFATGLTFADRDLDTARQEDLTAEQRLAYGCVASQMRQAFESNGESPRAMFIELATQSLLRLRR